MKSVIVPHFHYDVAYLRTFEEYLPLCFENLREAVRILDAEPEYRFLIEQAILLEEFRVRCPEEFARLRACAARGQVEVACGMWTMPDMNFPSGESLVRQALAGKAWVKEHLGLDVTTCWIADCWGHPATLPQILRHCGYTAYAFSRGMRPEFQRSDFRWRGLDGTEILTHWMPAFYGPLLFPNAQLENALDQEVVQTSEDRFTAILDRVRPALTTGHVLIGNGGDFARPQATGPEMVRAWRRHGHDVRFGLTSDHFAAVAQCDLPEYAGEFNPLLSGTYGSRIAIKQANRALEYALLAAERAVALLPEAASGEQEWLARYWQTALKNQFHDISSGTLVDAADADVMAEYAAAMAGAANVLALAVRPRQPPRPLEGSEGAETTTDSHVAFFNPSGFPRREPVRVPGDAGVVEDGTPLPCQPDALRGGSLVEVELAPLEVKVLRRADAPARKATDPAPADGPVVLDNGLVRVTVAPNGTLSSVVDLRTGRECVDPQRPWWGDLVYRNDNGDLWLLDRGPLDGGCPASGLTDAVVRDPYARSEDPLVNAGPFCQHAGRAKVTVEESGPLRWSVRATGALGFWRNRVEYATEITLRRGSRRIDFETLLTPSGRHYRVHACFPTAVRGGRIRHEVAFGVQERDERLFAAQNWIDLSDGKTGVCLLNRGIPGNQACDGVLSLLLFRSAAMEYKGPSEGAFYEGKPHTFHYGVMPWSADDEYLPHREGEAFNLPMAAMPCSGPEGVVSPGLAVAPANVHLAAYYRGGAGLILRVYEATGRACEAFIRLPAGITDVRECDGQERPGEAVPVTDGTLALPMRPFQIRSFLLGE